MSLMLTKLRMHYPKLSWNTAITLFMEPFHCLPAMLYIISIQRDASTLVSVEYQMRLILLNVSTINGCLDYKYQILFVCLGC